MRIALLGDAKNVYVQHWCESLVRAGGDVHLISLAKPRHQFPQVHLLPGPLLPGKLHYFTMVPYVRRLIKRLHPDLLVAYYVTGYGTLGALTNFHPIVQVTAGSDILFAPQNLLMRSLVRFNLSQADLVTAFAPHMTAAIRHLGIAEDHIFTLPPGIPLNDFRDFRCPSPVEGDFPRIIVTRSLEAFYRIDLILEVARLLRERGSRFLVTVVGDGSQRKKLIKETHRLGLHDVVTFTGFVPNHQLAALLAQHNLYISLAPWDGVSSSLLEAMAVGLYPIVTDHAANRSWIHGIEHGILVDDITPQKIADAVCHIINDQSHRESAWTENRKIVFERADLECNSREFLDRFRQVVKAYQH